MKLCLTSLSLLISLLISAQDRCGSDKFLLDNNRPESITSFNNWIERKTKERKIKSVNSSFALNQQAKKQVPIVFHVIHNGEAIGNGPNLTEERILGQLDVLNNDFGRLNSDTVNTPAQFLDVAADTDIQFVLAKQDPEGLPTNGITRTEYEGKEIFKDSDDELITSIIQWPPEDYINVYILNLDQYLGFANFPFSDLSGLSSEIKNFREKDGVFVRFSYFGFNNDNSLAFTSYGRTLTHEMGHYLGVLHVFQSGCFGSGDHCDDTPAQTKSTLDINEQCGSIPSTGCDEEERPMVENFMDYTDDVCMNLFTNDQKGRMQTVLAFSPRRKTLQNSHALIEPTIVANDLGVKEIRSPLKMDCSTSFTPSILVKNYGLNEIQSFTVNLNINNQLEQSKVFNNILPAGEQLVVSFSPLAINTTQLSTISFEVVSVNGINDGKTFNNKKEEIINPTESSILPFQISFNSNDDIHSYTELNAESKWQIITAPEATALNKAASIMFFEMSDSVNYGVKDLLVTDILDVSSLTSGLLSFRYSYSGRNSGQFLDELIVGISTDCGQTFHSEDYVFSRRGNNLITTSKTDVSYFPSSEFDWDQININITPYLESDEIQIGFIGVNGGGNNLFIDEVSVTSSNLPAYDLGLRRITNISPVTCSENLFPSVNVRNFGYERITKMVLSVGVNGALFSDTLKDFSLRSGESEDFAYKFEDLFEGSNELQFKILSINDTIDQQKSNDSIIYNVEINNVNDTIPIRKSFESGMNDWVINEVNDAPLLALNQLTGRNTVIKGHLYDTGIVGSQSYLVSPNLNTSKIKYGAIRFQLSHAQRPSYSDNLKILLSVNCGISYDIEVYNQNSSDLAATISDDSWIPESDEDWTSNFVDISEHMIWNNLRIAFVFTNGQGNNIYVDDIEVLTSNDPTQIIPEFNFSMYPNPAEDVFNLSFKLAEKQKVNFRMIDLTGKIVLERDLVNVLNQKYEVIAPSEKGVYLVVVTGSDIRQIKRIVIN